MEISSNFNVYPQKISDTSSFGERYPVKDIMCIMSNSEIIGKRSDSFEQTVAGVLRKPIGTTFEERSEDYQNAMRYLNEKYPRLSNFAAHFRNMLDSVSKNHFAITNDDIGLVTSRVEKQFGNKFVDII